MIYGIIGFVVGAWFGVGIMAIFSYKKGDRDG